MPYYSRDDEDVDDFDEFDPTPYGGGYDLALTYGRPLPPSDETCYTSSSADGDFEYERPEFGSHSDHSAYGGDAPDNEYSSYSRPNRRPGSGASGNRRRPDSEEHGSGYRRKPKYGEGEEFESPRYERRDDDDDDDENRRYGRKKYGDDNSDDDEDEEKRRQRHHHRRRNSFDDE